MRSPDTDEIKAARKLAGLSQSAAAKLIHCSLRVWQKWELGESKMHPSFWELFQLKRKAEYNKLTQEMLEDFGEPEEEMEDRILD